MSSRHPRLAGLLLGISMLIEPLAWPLLLVVAIRRMSSAEVTAVLVTLAKEAWALPACWL
jgi:hypothetical protein